MRLDCEEVYLKLKIYGRLCQPGLRVLAPVTRKGTPDLHEGGHIGQLEIRYTRIAHYLFGLHLVGNITLKSHLIDYTTLVCTLKARVCRDAAPALTRKFAPLFKNLVPANLLDLRAIKVR